MTTSTPAAGHVASETIDLQMPDGIADAFFAIPDDGQRHSGAIIYMDAFGIRPALEEFAIRLASYGYAVLVPNVFYRHGRSPVAPDLHRLMHAEDRTELFAALRPRMDAMTPEAIHADAEMTIAHMRSRDLVLDAPLGLTGYCMGGRLALRIAGEFAGDVAAAASFHGGNLCTDQPDSPHLAAVNATGELYIGHADQDHSMPPEQAANLTCALMEAGVRHTSELYKGATHGWTQTDTAAFNEVEAERHWARLTELFGRTLEQ